VVLDDWIATVSVDPDALPDLNCDAWRKTFSDSIYQYEFEDTDLNTVQELSAEMEDAVSTANTETTRDRVLDAMDRIKPTVPLVTQTGRHVRSSPATAPRGENPDVDVPLTSTASPSTSRPRPVELPVPRPRSPPAIPSPLKPPKPTPAPPPSPAPTPIVAPNNTSSLRRSTRSTAGKGVT